MMSVVPLIGLFLFLAHIIAGQIHIARQAASLRQLCGLAVKAGSLVHELQTERGKTAGFVTGKGAVPHPELKEQRGKTDTAAREITDYLSRHKKGIADAELAGAINAAWKNMAGLENVRQSVDSAKFSPQQTIEYYSRLTDSFLRIISRVPPLMTKSEFFPTLTAYLNLFYVKENAGVERGALYSLFIKDTSDPWSLRTARAAVTAQDIFVEKFLSYASPGQKDYYSSKMRRPFMDEIEKMRGLAFKNEQGPWGVDPLFWFKTATEKIDALKETGDYLARDLITSSESAGGKASSILNLIAMGIAITVTALNFALAFKFKLLRRGMLLISSGLSIGILVHSIVELLESLNIMSIDFLVILMPILVSTGSLLIITGGVFVARDAIQPLATIMRDMRGFSSPESPFHIAPEITKLNNEIGVLARGIQELIGNFKRTTISKIHLENIITTANDAFITVGEEGSILEWNPAAERTFGWSRQEAIGKPLAQTIIPFQHREAHLKGLSRFIGTGEGPIIGKTLELTALHRDGHEFPIELTIWAVRSDKKYQFNAFIRDITERKTRENELREAHKEITGREKALHSMFKDLQEAHENLKQSQNQLLQSEKMASVGQLAAGVAHEINNPMGFISNNMEILEQYIADYAKILNMTDRLTESVEGENLAEAHSIVAEINKLKEEINLDYVISDTTKLLQHNRDGIERIQKIVMDLRVFAREDKNEMEHVKVEEVIEGILTIVQSEIKYKAKLEKNYGDTPLIECNPKRLGQVFLNLIVNALHAIKGTGTIEIKTYTQDKFVCVDVSDTGKGIEEQNLGKVFDPFFTTKPAGQGTGLGLSVSYEIIKKHGGEMTVRSKAGEGTTFTVMLPLQMEHT